MARDPKMTAYDPEMVAHFKKVAAKIARLRLALGLNQKELGELAGLGQSSINQMENGGKLPSMKSLWRLSKALGCHPHELLMVE